MQFTTTSYKKTELGIFESSVERVSLNLSKGFSYRKGKIQVCLTT